MELADTQRSERCVRKDVRVRVSPAPPNLISMRIHDIAYGNFEYDEPVILELLASPELDRLKNVSQFGVPDKYSSFTTFSRYEHCVGVMNLLKLLGANTEEQVAGLLHDVSQFSFSHVVDWVFGDGSNGNESYHDSLHHEFVLKTGIPKILDKYGYSTEQILNEENFPLLENSIPDICADRIDYCLREAAHNGNTGLVSKVVGGLKAEGGKIFFAEMSSAAKFANEFLDLQLSHWGSDEAVGQYLLLSSAFRVVVAKKLISRDDFWIKTEDELMDILRASKETEIIDILSQLERGDFSNTTGRQVAKKFRHVDPLVQTSESLKRLSKLDSKFAMRLNRARKQSAVS